MKKATVFKFSLLMISALCLPHGVAQDFAKWDLPDGAKSRLGKGWIREIQYSPDGTRIAAASTIGIWLYDTATHQEAALFTGHEFRVESIVFSPDGRTIASGSGDTTIRLWDADTGKHLRKLEGHTDSVESVAFSPDGRIIASGSWDGTIRLWASDSGKTLRKLKGHTDSVESVAFSPDGRTLATGSRDNTIRPVGFENGRTSESSQAAC